MKSLSIRQFQDIVSDCLTNSGKYKGKSIVLWDSHPGPESIEYQIIKNCCISYNKAHGDNQVWFKELLTMDSEVSYFVTTSKVVCERKDMYGWKSRGIVLDDGIISFLAPAEEELSQWLRWVNTHEVQGKTLSTDWTLIACAQTRNFAISENMFSEDCILFEFKPSVEEWAEWMKDKCDEKILKPIVAFIKEKDSTIDLFYWNIAVDALKRELVHNDYETLSQLSHEEFDSCLGGVLAFKIEDFPYDELWEFIQNNPS